MKKHLVSLLFVFALVVVPVVTHAGILDDLWRQVLQLQQIVLHLISQRTNSSTIVYHNDQYGFDLKLPADWENYKVINDQFYLPTSNTVWNNQAEVKGYGSAFALKYLSPAEWTKMKTDCGAEGSQKWNSSCYRDSDILLRTEKVVVVSDWPNSGPDVTGDKEWGKLAKEVSKDYLKKNISISSSSSIPVMCTADAMQCPDGSWIGRSGPKCEFKCPIAKTKCIPAGGLTYQNVYSTVPPEQRLKCCSGLEPRARAGAPADSAETCEIISPNVSCPLLAPVGPNFCPNGQIVSGGTDANGCQLAPKCED